MVIQVKFLVYFQLVFLYKKGDNWVIVCDKLTEGTPLKAFNVFHLQHLESRAFLYTALENQFNQRNCGNCPIQGQLEISGDGDKGSRTKWKVVSVSLF